MTATEWASDCKPGSHIALPFVTSQKAKVRHKEATGGLLVKKVNVNVTFNSQSLNQSFSTFLLLFVSSCPPKTFPPLTLELALGVGAVDGAQLGHGPGRSQVEHDYVHAHVGHVPGLRPLCHAPLQQREQWQNMGEGGVGQRAALCKGGGGLAVPGSVLAAAARWTALTSTVVQTLHKRPQRFLVEDRALCVPLPQRRPRLLQPGDLKEAGKPEDQSAALL